MLGTRERTLLLEGLRPPSGYRLRRAVGTSFVLDLMALLSIPLAFTYFDVHDEEGEPTSDPVALLHALRLHAEKVSIFCQSGAIGVPHPNQPLLSFIEGSVVPVVPLHEGGIFHPKMWAINFESDDGPPIYRVLCLSRNLTFARAWDTCLILEGRLRDAQDEFPNNQPIAEFLRSLPQHATREISDDLAADIARMSAEICRVDFKTPPPFESFRVHNFGLGIPHGMPFPTGGRSLVISPFLTAGALGNLVNKHGLEILISRPESFAGVIKRSGRDVLPNKCFVLSPGAGLDARESGTGAPEVDVEGPSFGEDRIELTGLHAKLYLFEKGCYSHLFIGSANATGAAFHQNVEVLFELIGRRTDCGIDSMLGSDDDPRYESLQSLLQEFSLSEKNGNGPEIIELEWEAERLAYSLGAAQLTATATPADADCSWDVSLTGELPPIPDGARIKVWPSTLTAESATVISTRPNSSSELATFKGLSLEGLTGFFVFEVLLRDNETEVQKQFSAVVDLVGAPQDRIDIVTQKLLSDRRRVLQLIFLILAGQNADLPKILPPSSRFRAGSGRSLGNRESATLLESLLQSLDRDPDQIDEIDRLITSLAKTPQGKDLLPDGLEQIWEPVWQARQTLK
ncbi:MAG: hypothetical protein F4Y67_04475 [Chloroflexi bacterium]|nr:hypothetical protein [Chloroflexota bacterium]